MSIVCAKLEKKDSIRKILSVDTNIYPNIDIKNYNKIKFQLNYKLEDNQVFEIKSFSNEKFCIDLISKKEASLEFDSLKKEELSYISYIFNYSDDYIYFQRITPVKSILKKGLIFFGESFKYQEEFRGIIINEMPDAIYDRKSDSLYFWKLVSITNIFPKIDLLYKVPTVLETNDFFKKENICSSSGFDGSKVKKESTKRQIQRAKEIMTEYSEQKKEELRKYITKYYPKLVDNANKSYVVNSEEELKNVLNGIEELYYTTEVGNQKRLANSTIRLD